MQYNLRETLRKNVNISVMVRHSNGKKQVKFSLSTPQTHTGKEEVKLHLFFDSVLDTGEQLTHPAALPP